MQCSLEDNRTFQSGVLIKPIAKSCIFMSDCTTEKKVSDLKTKLLK
jgi:hypothetical protein